MTKNLARFDLKSSFLSCEKDTDTILRKLFIESRPFSDTLKRLLVISTKDCLDNTTSEIYNKKIQEMSVKKLIDEAYSKAQSILKEHRAILDAVAQVLMIQETISQEEFEEFFK